MGDRYFDLLDEADRSPDAGEAEHIGLVNWVVAPRDLLPLGHLPGHRDDFTEGVASFRERRPPLFAPLASPGPGPAVDLVCRLRGG